MLLARIRGSREQLRALAPSPLRVHHRGVRKISDTLFEVPAVLEEPEASLLELKGYEVDVQGDVEELLSHRLKPAADRGAPFTSPEELYSVGGNDGYMTVEYIENWTLNLATLFPALCSSIETPDKTWGGRTSSAIHLRTGDAADRITILFTSGVHAAELGGPDSSICFLYRLINAYLGKAPIVLGNKTFSAGRVQAIMENLDIFVLPCVNPDGRAYVQSNRVWWRKNRNPEVGMGAIGVDNNRNFDFLWSSGIGSSFIATDDTYKGAKAFSEPETRNVQWLLARSGADFFLDIHGPSGTLLYPWGDALDQSQDPGMNSLNPAWDSERVSSYGEYMDPRDATVFQQLGDRIVSAVNSVRDGAYQSQQSFADLYPTTGTSDDYSYSRHLADPNGHKTYAYTFEYGGGDFFPPYHAMREIINEVNAAMLELCDALVVSDAQE